ncbi:hypothetical protein AAFF_G00324420 [Aldrovandia affinis]|uniref:Fibroblast growth factor n=1 Tax=Aldrovandia affinis TaxID=143900 RepID=A0AAD7R6Y3_9TELE|nr:hypothetical protein AAFF_G00324420 [Aldrovandia affinis]
MLLFRLVLLVVCVSPRCTCAYADTNAGDQGSRLRNRWQASVRESRLNSKGWLKVFAMRQGVVGIQGLKSALYLCMNRDGISHGSGQFSSDCLFRENLEENHYTTYSSISHPGFYLALSHRGAVRRGGSVRKEQPCTHFLPRRAQ